MSIKTVTSSLPPASPSSPGLRYDADDEAPLPLGDTSNHTRHFTDSSKLSVLPTATVNINGWLTNQSSPAIKNRLRHRDVSLPEAATKPSVLSPPSVGVAAQRLTQSQLADALKEIERLRAYVRTLEASRADLKRDVAELRAKQEKDLADERVRGEKERVQDEQTGKADGDAKAEKAKRDKADVDVRRLRAEVTLLRGKCEEAEENAREEQRKRVAVEEELEKLALGV